EVIENKEWEHLTKAGGDFVERQYDNQNFTFKVKCRRSDKHYPLTSPEVCMEMGGYLLERFPTLSVDVHNPEVLIWVEVREKAYVYSRVFPGAGGMPLGTNGKAMLLLSGGIDSPVAGYMIAKRGVYIDAVYFHAPPYTSERAKQKVVDLAKLISRYTGPIHLHVVDFTEIQLAIYELCPHEELTIIMRRYMMRIAETLAERSDCLGMITGESIGQVASQTMHSLAATNDVCHLPVYRPLIGFDKQEIVDIADRIGTYETSIQPYEDCCTIFVAKHPVTKPEIKRIRQSEKNLAEKIDEMVQTALNGVEVITIS
ncbi:MAG: tRNA 4-thiouridine(8) synthase ThiI, partial [Lachnospiraceae bacterium]|nr:tRNA 4-thiouridine(8) synthase ThiI [Lachnospiraceae bacterium]